MNTEDMEYIRKSFQDVHTALASIKSSIRRFAYVFGAVAGALVMHIYYDLSREHLRSENRHRPTLTLPK